MSATLAWGTRCIPAFSCALLAVLMLFAFVVSPYGRGENGKHTGDATLPQRILGTWCALLHVLSIVFPVRVCYAMQDVLRKTRATANDIACSRRRSVQSIREGQGTEQFPVPLFVIIIPAYKEEMANLEETLRVLSYHAQARSSYHVYLAMEEKEEKSAFKASSLCSTFQHSFFRMSYTVHPSNIPGEAQGKSSNESWAAKQIMKDYTDAAVKQNTIITTMDADTHLPSRYFTQIARMHSEFPDTRDTTIYVPPLVFDRNLHHVPLFVRTSDLMWAGAGLSSLYASASVCIPTSVYSLPMTLVERVGGWDTGPGAIGEDMHMYLKCFFALSGNLTCQKVFAAASQCNVSSDQRGILGYYKGLQARYKQALRHMWGALDTGFAVREAIKMIKRHSTATQKQPEVPLSAPKCDYVNPSKPEQGEANHIYSSNWTAFYTSTGLHKSLTPKIANNEKSQDNKAEQPMPIHWINVLTLFHRLFEAHFLPIHLATILTASGVYSFFYPAFLIPSYLKTMLDFSGWCRLVGFCTMLVFFCIYERYHRLCVGLRKEEMRQAGMLEDMEEQDAFTPHVFQQFGLLEVATFPIGGFIFGAIPALQAVLSHLFTDRLTYVVSLKPQLALKPWQDMSRITP